LARAAIDAVQPIGVAAEPLVELLRFVLTRDR
jgi:hypothetical protein